MDIAKDDEGKLAYIVPDKLKNIILDKKKSEPSDHDFSKYWISKLLVLWCRLNHKSFGQDKMDKLIKLLHFTYFEYKRTNQSQDTAKVISLKHNVWDESINNDKYILCVGQLVYDYTLSTEESQFTLVTRLYGFVNRRELGYDPYPLVKPSRDPMSVTKSVNGCKVLVPMILIPSVHATNDIQTLLQWVNNPTPSPNLTIDEPVAVELPPQEEEEPEPHSMIYLFQNKRPSFPEISHFFRDECRQFNFSHMVIGRMYLYRRIYEENVKYLGKYGKSTPSCLFTVELDIDTSMNNELYMRFERVWSLAKPNPFIDTFIEDYFNQITTLEQDRFIILFLASVTAHESSMLYWTWMAEMHLLRRRFGILNQKMRLLPDDRLAAISRQQTADAAATQKELLAYMFQAKRYLDNNELQFVNKDQCLADLTMQCLDIYNQTMGMQ